MAHPHANDMLDLSQAKEIAQRWLERNRPIPDDRFVIRNELTRERPFGWVFCYHTERWLETRDPKYDTKDNAPLIIDRANGSVHVTGTAHPLDHYIAEYERTKKPKF